MTNGRLVSLRFPYLPIQLELRLQGVELEALLDTGFDGDVIVPRPLITTRFAPDGYLWWTLADGSRVLAPYYVGTVRVGQLGAVPAVVTTLGDEPLVGRGVTGHFTIILDHGQRLMVEP